MASDPTPAQRRALEEIASESPCVRFRRCPRLDNDCPLHDLGAREGGRG